MKKMGDLFKELGFKKDASLDVQRAFFKHLIQAADRSTPRNSNSISEQKVKPLKSGEQLAFDPEVLKAGND